MEEIYINYKNTMKKSLLIIVISIVSITCGIFIGSSIKSSIAEIPNNVNQTPTILIQPTEIEETITKDIIHEFECLVFGDLNNDKSTFPFLISIPNNYDLVLENMNESNCVFDIHYKDSTLNITRSVSDGMTGPVSGEFEVIDKENDIIRTKGKYIDSKEVYYSYNFLAPCPTYFDAEHCSNDGVLGGISYVSISFDQSYNDDELKEIFEIFDEIVLKSYELNKPYLNR